MNEEQKRREMQIERMQEDLLNCLVFSRNGGVKCRETAEEIEQLNKAQMNMQNFLRGRLYQII